MVGKKMSDGHTLVFTVKGLPVITRVDKREGEYRALQVACPLHEHSTFEF